MTEVSLISYSRYVHGLYNSIVIVLFLYQAWLGFRIRKARTNDLPPSFALIKRHRRFGPVLAVLGISGFPLGMAVVYLDEGHVFEHPLHFMTGLTIVLLIMFTFLISRKIKGRESPWRNPHFAAGVTLLFAYFLQAFWGIGILF